MYQLLAITNKAPDRESITATRSRRCLLVLRGVDVDGLSFAGVHPIFIVGQCLLVHHPVDFCEDLSEGVINVGGVEGRGFNEEEALIFCSERGRQSILSAACAMADAILPGRVNRTVSNGQHMQSQSERGLQPGSSCGGVSISIGEMLDGYLFAS